MQDGQSTVDIIEKITGIEITIDEAISIETLLFKKLSEQNRMLRDSLEEKEI